MWQAGLRKMNDTNSNNEYKIAAEEQRRIAEIGRLLSAHTDINAVYSAFAEQAKKLVPFDRLAISTIDPKTGLISDAHIAGIQLEAANATGPYTLEESALPPEVYEDHRVVAADAERLRNYEYFGEVVETNMRIIAGLPSAMFTPIVLQGKLLGSLVFRSKQKNPYGEHEIELASQIASQIAGVISLNQQITLLEQETTECDRMVFEQARIAEIGRIISSTLELDEVFSSFADQARQLIPFDRLVISINEPDGLSATDAYIDGESFEGGDLGRRYPIAGGYKQVTLSNSAFNPSYDELLEMSKSSPSEQARIDAGFRSLLMVAMFSQAKPVGTLIFRSKALGMYGDRHVDIAKQIGAQIGGAVAASRQYQLLDAESTERERLALEQAQIAEIGRIISSTLDITEVLTAFVEQARSLVPFDRIVITVVNNDLTEVTDVLVDGVTVERESIGVSYALSENNIQADVISKQEVFVSLGEDYLRHTSEVAGEQIRYDAGLRSMLMVPLVWKGRSIGSLNLRSTDRHAFGSREIELANQIGAQIAGAIATSTQYRQLEEAIADVQVQAAALEAADDAIIIRTADTTVVYVNSGFERQTGFSKEEVVGTKFQYPENVGQPPEFLDNLRLQVRGGKIWRDTVQCRRKDGTEYIVDATLSPIFNESGEFDKYLGVRRDVTQQVRSAGAIRTQAAALEAAGDAVMILNPDASIDWVNEAFVRDTGYSRDEAMLLDSPFLISGRDAHVVFDEIWERAQAGEAWQGSVWTRRKDGSEYLADSSLTPVLSDDGTITRIVCTKRDVTGIVQAEEDRAAKRELDARNQQLLVLNEQREEFFSTVSHELRTPLTSIMAFADILSRNRDGTLTSRQREHLDVIKRNSRSLNSLVEDMLDFSRLSTEQLKLEKSEFEIHSLLNSVIESLEPTAGQRGQTLSIEPNAEPVWIKADHRRVIQIISNLITNSCKYSPSDSRITVRVETEGGDLSVLVLDQGVGISPGDLENIYLPFFRSNQTEVREEAGSGLGLAITKTLVDLHGGTIKAKSLLNEGTRIVVTLPGATSAPTVDARS